MVFIPLETDVFTYQHLLDSEDNTNLIKHYKTFGFHRLSKEEEKFVHSHVKPKYDDGCVFMYQLV